MSAHDGGDRVDAAASVANQDGSTPRPDHAGAKAVPVRRRLSADLRVHGYGRKRASLGPLPPA
eukprot:6719045-Lingulodinium_polyedra.AAC.1